MTRLKIYVAGPYTGKTDEQIQANVDAAIDAGIEVMKKGHIPYIPHLTHYIALRPSSPWSKIDRRWVALDSNWFSYCDAILVLSVVRPDGSEAVGVVTELIAFAQRGAQIFRNVEDIPTATEGPFEAIDKLAKFMFGVRTHCKKCGQEDYVLSETEKDVWVCIHCGERQIVEESADKNP